MLGLSAICSAPICSLIDIRLSLSESIAVSESKTNYTIINRLISETLSSLSESAVAVNLHAFLQESLSVTEQVSLLKVLNRSASDSLSLSEILDTHGIITRVLSENIELLDYVLRQLSASASDDLSISESLHYVLNQNADDLLTITEDIVNYKIITKALSDTLTITESAKRILPFEFIESINIIETLGVKCVFILHVAEAIQLIESYQIVSYLKRLQEEISPVEIVTYHLVPYTSATDSLIITESVIVRNIPFEHLVESIDLTEDNEFRLIPKQDVSDDIDIIEEIVNNTILHYTFCDCIIISEAVRKVKPLSITDTITLTDRANSNPMFDTIHITESIVTNIIDAACCHAAYIPNKSIKDTISILESLALKKVLNISMSENLSVNDTVAYLP